MTLADDLRAMADRLEPQKCYNCGMNANVCISVTYDGGWENIPYKDGLPYIATGLACRYCSNTVYEEFERDHRIAMRSNGKKWVKE